MLSTATKVHLNVIASRTFRIEQHTAAYSARIAIIFQLAFHTSFRINDDDVHHANAEHFPKSRNTKRIYCELDSTCMASIWI